jgi:ubiquinone/menaquinone biosynthesis C-methylase UbiE
MGGITIAAAAVTGLVLLVVITWWLFIGTEGVFLGRWVVIWLYDLYASRYDRIKQVNPDHESLYLAQPILERIPHVRAPLVLDVATGTGRLPLALLEQPSFQGRIVAVDLSRKMLSIAADKLKAHRYRASLLHNPAEKLPFPDNTFDLVTCLEALELTVNPRVILHELVRVLRPGGLLIVTKRCGSYARLFPGKMTAADSLEQMMGNDLSLRHVEFQIWQTEYQLVWALKAGKSAPTGPRLLAEIWMCPACGKIDMAAATGGWRCETCGTFVPVGADGVIEVMKPIRAPA